MTLLWISLDRYNMDFIVCLQSARWSSHCLTDVPTCKTGCSCSHWLLVIGTSTIPGVNEECLLSYWLRGKSEDTRETSGTSNEKSLFQV